MVVLIDGSYGEGGGQILRTGIGLSAALSIPIKIEKIRANRPKPGLAAQHLHGIKSVARLCGAEVKGLSLGSTEVEFVPGKFKKERELKIDIGTAGSISLVLQALMIPTVFQEREIDAEITGGTDVEWSPPIDYTKNVLIPIISKMNYKCEIEILKRGYYPKGGGKVRAKFYPAKKLEAIKINERGKLKKISGISHAGNLPSHIIERQKKAAEELLASKLSLDKNLIEISLEKAETLCPGTGITLWAEYEKTVLGASALGKPGKKAEKVGEEAAENLLTEISSHSTVDSHLSDQIIPYAAFAKGETEYIAELTMHAETNLYVVDSILKNKIRIEKLEEVEKEKNIKRIRIRGTA